MQDSIFLAMSAQRQICILKLTLLLHISADMSIQNLQGGLHNRAFCLIQSYPHVTFPLPFVALPRPLCHMVQGVLLDILNVHHFKAFITAQC